MKRHIQLLFICFLFCSSWLNAQSLSTSVIASGGTTVVAGGNILSFSVGEMSAVSTLDNGSYILTQGFEQADIIQTSNLLSLESNEKGSMIIYPNPANRLFIIGYKLPVASRVRISLFDIKGQFVNEISQENYLSGQSIEQFDCSNLSVGEYLITLEYNALNSSTSTVLQKKLIITRQ